jgi:NAD(P)H-dependent FMN reductase
MSVKILAFSGSSRAGSFNQKLIGTAAAGARESGAETTILNLQDFPLPIYNQDLEAKEGLPEAAVRLKEIFVAHDGLLIASPEYNSSITPLLKNTIDWVSRPADDESPLSAYHHKVAGIMAASPGGLGGLRGLVHLRSILQNIGVMVVPKQMAIAKAHEAFAEDGTLKVEFQQKTVTEIGQMVAKVASALNPEP